MLGKFDFIKERFDLAFCTSYSIWLSAFILCRSPPNYSNVAQNILINYQDYEKFENSTSKDVVKLKVLSTCISLTFDLFLAVPVFRLSETFFRSIAFQFLQDDLTRLK